MSLQITITPAKIRVVQEESPEIINVPMTRREAEVVRAVIRQATGPAAYSLYTRLRDVDVQQAKITNKYDIPLICIAEGTED